MPQHLGKALDRMVQRLVAPGAAPQKRLPAPADAGRLVDRELLLEREMQAHVQEGIGLVGVVALHIPLRLLQHAVVFGVLQDDVERGRLDAYQRDRLPVFAPGAEKHLPYVIARGAEHLSSSAGTRRGRGSGTRGSRGGARGRYSAREG